LPGKFATANEFEKRNVNPGKKERTDRSNKKPSGLGKAENDRDGEMKKLKRD